MSDKEQTNIVTPHENDVLSGRGGMINSHIGNLKFIDRVKSLRKSYVRCDKSQKPMYAKIIYKEIRSMVPAGRFLKRDTNTGLWNTIGKKKTLAKIRQALREGAPELLKEIKDGEASGGSNTTDYEPIVDQDPGHLLSSEILSSRKKLKLMSDVSISDSSCSSTNNSDDEGKKPAACEKDDKGSERRKRSDPSQSQQDEKKMSTKRKMSCNDEESPESYNSLLSLPMLPTRHMQNATFSTSIDGDRTGTTAAGAAAVQNQSLPNNSIFGSNTAPVNAFLQLQNAYKEVTQQAGNTFSAFQTSGNAAENVITTSNTPASSTYGSTGQLAAGGNIVNQAYSNNTGISGSNPAQPLQGEFSLANNANIYQQLVQCALQQQSAHNSAAPQQTNPNPLAQQSLNIYQQLQQLQSLIQQQSNQNMIHQQSINNAPESSYPNHRIVTNSTTLANDLSLYQQLLQRPTQLPLSQSTTLSQQLFANNAAEMPLLNHTNAASSNHLPGDLNLYQQLLRQQYLNQETTPQIATAPHQQLTNHAAGSPHLNNAFLTNSNPATNEMHIYQQLLQLQCPTQQRPQQPSANNANEPSNPNQTTDNTGPQI